MIEPIRLSWIRNEISRLFKCSTQIIVRENQRKEKYLDIELTSYFSSNPFTVQTFISLKDLNYLSQILHTEKIYICEGTVFVDRGSRIPEDRDEYRKITIRMIIEGVEIES